MENKDAKERRRTFFWRMFFLDVLLDKKARPIVVYVVVFILLSATAFHYLEGWGWLDSIYFVTITFATIGYGDFVPTTALTKLITIFVGLNGIAILLLLIDEIRRVRTWHRSSVPEKAKIEG